MYTCPYSRRIELVLDCFVAMSRRRSDTIPPPPPPPLDSSDCYAAMLLCGMPVSLDWVYFNHLTAHLCWWWLDHARALAYPTDLLGSPQVHTPTTSVALYIYLSRGCFNDRNDDVHAAARLDSTTLHRISHANERQRWRQSSDRCVVWYVRMLAIL